MSLFETKKQLEELQEDISQKLLLVKSIDKDLKQQEKNIEYASEVISNKLGNNVESGRFLNFFKKPYVITSNGKNSILVFAPKFIKGFQVGWLNREDETYYVYELNQYSSWLGETNNRVQIIKDNLVTVVSRVGDLGISIDDLERIIEVDFLFGSRQQELQRLGRLMHSNKKDLLHYIIMTEQELQQHSKRLWALREKGFHVRISSK